MKQSNCEQSANGASPGGRRYFAVVSLLLIVAVIAGVAIGSSPISPNTVARVLLFHIVPHG